MREFEVIPPSPIKREEAEYMMPASKAELIPSTGGMVFQPLEFTEEQKTLIKRMCQAEGLDDNEFAVFMHICQKRRLDPILRQIYATKRSKKVKEGNVDKWVKILVPIVAIEGMTAIADRAGTYSPSGKPVEVVFAKAGDKTPLSVTVWVKKYRQGEWHEFSFTGYFAEFVQDTDTWRKMPIHMLTKCARAGALRMGWPEDCGGLYIEEEWGESYSEAPGEPVKRKERERGSIDKLKQSKEDNRGHGAEGLEQAKQKPLDQYTTSIKSATLKAKGEKKWLECKIEGGTASIWNDLSVAYRDEEIPLTPIYCWHQSLFEALLLKPQKIVISVASKDGSKFSPVIEDILAVDGQKYEKGKPYVAPEVAEMPKKTVIVSPGVKEKLEADIPELKSEISEHNGPDIAILTKQRGIRTESILRLSNAFEKIWPAADLSKRVLRNTVGQTLLNLKSKDQLNDLAYPQDNIDAAIEALKRFALIEPPPTTEEGVLNDITHLFKEEKKRLAGAKEFVDDLFA